MVGMEDATTRQQANFRSAWLKEAIDELNHYRKDPFTDDFMKEHGLRRLPTKKAAHARLRNRITRSKKPPNFEQLVEYVDELKLWGKQCVSLYTLKYAEKEYLKQLVNPDYIKERLSKFSLEDRYNDNICRWKSDRPFLSEVRHNFDHENKRGKLSFKWISTRLFQAFVGPTLVTFDERSVNFFIIDLADGSAELRIQSLPPKSLTTIGAELQTYTQEIERLLDFNRFSPISLQPVMREFLLKKVLPITHWSVRTQQGNLIGAKVSPSFAQRALTLRFRNVTPHEVMVYWKCDQIVGKGDRLYFQLEADDNVTVFNAITDKLRVNYLVSSLLEAARPHSKDKKIDVRELIDPPPTRRGILQGGIRDWIWDRVTGTPGEKIKKATAEAAILPALALNKLIFDSLRSWLIDTTVERITHVPFIVFEILVYAILLFVFYGGDRSKRLFFKIPPRYATVAIKLFLGKSSEIIIDSTEFRKWKEANLYNLYGPSRENSVNSG